MTEQIHTIGFIGAGGIGQPMAERLIGSGFALTVCDRREEALASLAAFGAKTTKRPSDCGTTDLVVVMVADDAQAIAIVAGDNGLLKGIDPASPPLVAVMSTVLPATVRHIASLLAPLGVRTVDAPVSGGPLGAAQGALSIIAGGEPDDVAALRPVFAALGNRIFHTGSLGAGEAIKILNNLMAVTNEFLMTELVLIARNLGIDTQLLCTVMEASSGRNFVTADVERVEATFRRMVADPALIKAHVDLCRKDLRLAQELARQSGISAALVDEIASAHNAISYGQVLDARSKMAKGQGDDRAPVALL